MLEFEIEHKLCYIINMINFNARKRFAETNIFRTVLGAAISIPISSHPFRLLLSATTLATAPTALTRIYTRTERSA
jgi:hypothetical protein